MSKGKTLFIVRHAKSSWSQGDLSDHDRPLNDRGMRDAPRMAGIFAEREVRPDHWVSSTALRAKTTAQFFAEAFDPVPSVELTRKIYEANLSSLLHLINGFPATANSAIMFGHNPGFSYLASSLAHVDLSLPTCCIVKVELHVDDWKAVSSGTGTLVHMDTPKQHRSE
jgi:phosphohistidine phosphatase